MHCFSQTKVAKCLTNAGLKIGVMSQMGVIQTQRDDTWMHSIHNKIHNAHWEEEKA